jgi:diguanylate cyclase (GGDEF)-like protein/PAS domain S-box-containing protein
MIPWDVEEVAIDLRLFIELVGLLALIVVLALLLAAGRTRVRNREAQSRQDVIFHTIPDPVLITRLKDGVILEVNAGFLQLSGFERSEVIGSTSLEINVWKNPEERLQFLDLIRREGRCERFPADLLKKDGTPLLGSITARVFQLGSEPCLMTVVTDQTARDRAETALRRSEERYRLLADHASDVIWTMSLEGRFTYVSPSVLGLRGYTPEEVLNQSLAESICPGSLATVEEGFRRTFLEIRTGVASPPQYFEIEQPCRDGTTVWTEASARVMYDAQHKALGIVGVTRNITERRRLERELFVRATTDSLTGATNRRRFLELAQVEFKRARRTMAPLTLALIDLDRFKQINDSLGHSAGDKALIAVTQICQRNIRDIDVFARFGGDEFVLLFPDTAPEQARVILERIQDDLGDDEAPFTVCGGIVGLTEEMNSLDRLLERADLLLYRAKDAGRNRLVVDTVELG